MCSMDFLLGVEFPTTGKISYQYKARVYWYDFHPWIELRIATCCMQVYCSVGVSFGSLSVGLSVGLSCQSACLSACPSLAGPSANPSAGRSVSPSYHLESSHVGICSKFQKADSNIGKISMIKSQLNLLRYRLYSV